MARLFGIYKFLRNSSGEANARGNYSSAPEVFFIGAGPGEELVISRMLVSIEFTRPLKHEGYDSIDLLLEIEILRAIFESPRTLAISSG